MNLSFKTYKLTQIALMAALLCVTSPFAVAFPFSPVPVSLTTVILYLSPYILGKRDATISCGIYLLIGAVGMPVFSGFTGGIGKVLGPTGGYMFGYLFLTFITGWFVETNRTANRLMQGFGMVLGTAVCYLLGSFWLSYQAGMTFSSALMMGAVLFIPGDVVKIIIAVIAGNIVRKRLLKAGMV